MGEITECVNGRRPETWPRVYVEMRRLSSSILQHECSNARREGITAVVHEAWARLQSSPPPMGWDSRAHFFGSACRAMRQALVDEARKSVAAKRRTPGGKAVGAEEASDLRSIGSRAESVQRILDVDAAVAELAKAEPRWAAVAEMKLFGNLPNELIAERLGASRRTIERDWESASQWLRDRLG